MIGLPCRISGLLVILDWISASLIMAAPSYRNLILAAVLSNGIPVGG
jgi:hypothetical protein